MAHLTLQLNGAIVVPMAAPRAMSHQRSDRFIRAVREAAARAAGIDRLGWCFDGSRGPTVTARLIRRWQGGM